MDVINEIGTAIMRWQDWTQTFDEKVAERLNLSMRELRCLSALARAPLSAKELAAEVNLSAAAVTALVDRLEGRALVERTHDTQDRRKVVIRATRTARQMTERLYSPIAADGRALLESFSQRELATILRFVKGATELQERHAKRLAR